jgi:zinc transporter
VGIDVNSSVSIISPANEHHYDATGFTWFYIQADAPNSKECLHHLGLQNEIVDALYTTNTIPKAMQFVDVMLVYLSSINRNPDATFKDMVSLRLWFSDNIVTSVKPKVRKLLSLQDVKEEDDIALLETY